MFNLEDFLITSLIGGFQTGAFNEYQINIFAMNYLNRGQLSQDGFDEILQAIEYIKNPPELEEVIE
ncbi:hypothetical protein PML80_03615 [Aerococcus urinaeequi]|uniref:Uncharacterized protein n=1 Tax=Aerococcus urinaeequi TaxID=51665 RepID=A0AAE9XN97_9LACT|nr:hypothetical protein [Aerococcus urinaeequi]WCG38421.1 hypothetical protein PML80_03615 [Aerococcus urinaeequi]